MEGFEFQKFVFLWVEIIKTVVWSTACPISDSFGKGKAIYVHASERPGFYRDSKVIRIIKQTGPLNICCKRLLTLYCTDQITLKNVTECICH